MRHPEDRLTLELPDLGAPATPAPAAAKRGRGRPRKDNALSDADRARRYRQRQALKRQLGEQIKTMNLGQIGRMRRAAPTGSLKFSVLCELTMKNMFFVPVTAP